MMHKLMQKPKKTKARFGSMALLAALLILPLIFNAMDFTYGVTISVFVMIYIIAVSGLDILFGYSGQISMGHAAFYAIGAYGSAMLARYFGVPVLLTMVIAPILAAAVGALLAYPASKLVFHFLSLATIAFGEIVYQLILQSPGGVTGNAVGFATKRINLFGFQLSSYFYLYFFSIIFVVLFLIAKEHIIKSRVGRAFVAIRENAHAAEGMGIDVRKYKIIAFAVSAFYVAFAGSMYAHIAGYISAETFTNRQSVMFITILLFGGTASKWGPVLGSISILILNELLRSLENLQMLVYGILLLIVILAVPGGLYGLSKTVLSKLRKKEVR